MENKPKAFSDKFLAAAFKTMAQGLTKNLKDIPTEELMGHYLPLFAETAQNGKTKEARMEALELVKNIIKEAKTRNGVSIQAIQLDGKTGERISPMFGKDPLDMLVESLEKSISEYKEVKSKVETLSISDILNAPLTEDLKK